MDYIRNVPSVASMWDAIPNVRTRPSPPDGAAEHPDQENCLPKELAFPRFSDAVELPDDAFRRSPPGEDPFRGVYVD